MPLSCKTKPSDGVIQASDHGRLRLHAHLHDSARGLKAIAFLVLIVLLVACLLVL